jgi:predicted lipoprotein
MRKIVKYIIGTLTIILVIFLSVDLKKLDIYKNNPTKTEFNAAEYAANIWNGPLQSATHYTDIECITNLLKKDPQKAFNEYSNKLGISKTHYFMVKGTGIIESIEDEWFVVLLENQLRTRIATDFIFGNAVRDGSGWVNIDDFVNMSDFNHVSLELNKLVKDQIVGPLKKKAQPGKKISFTGAFEMNEENPDPEEILIIPVKASINE